MLFDIHMFGKAGFIFNMGAAADIKAVLKVFERLAAQVEPLFKAAKSCALVFSIKAVGPAKQLAGSKGPAVLIIAAFDQIRFASGL